MSAQFLPHPVARHNTMALLQNLSRHLETLGHMGELNQKVVDVRQFLENMSLSSGQMLAVQHLHGPTVADLAAAQEASVHVITAAPVAVPEASVRVAPPVVEIAPMTLLPPGAFAAPSRPARTVHCQCCGTQYIKAPGTQNAHRDVCPYGRDHSRCEHYRQNALRNVRLRARLNV